MEGTGTEEQRDWEDQRVRGTKGAWGTKGIGGTNGPGRPKGPRRLKGMKDMGRITNFYGTGQKMMAFFWKRLTFSWQDPVQLWKAGPIEVMTGKFIVLTQRHEGPEEARGDRMDQGN